MSSFRLSSFGERFSGPTGIAELMTDLSSPPSDPSAPFSMLGGGNPAIVPEIDAAWREALRGIVDGPGFSRLAGAYDSQIGSAGFREAVAGLFASRYGWKVDERNVGVVNGSQLAAFYLINMFSGPFPDGRRRKILLPIVPEYVGYADQGIDPECFAGRRPSIDLVGERSFKYRVDFEGLALDGAAGGAGAAGSVGVAASIGAILVSRPTNPTGNVLSDEEVRRLAALAGGAGVPLILDNAYGLPFPGIVFRDASPIWNENLVLCMSLSKIGLPALRTGIVVARPELIEALAATNAIASLATGSLGPAVAESLIRSGELERLSREVLRPYYEAKSKSALDIIGNELSGLPWRVHASEGAIFLWLWLENLPIPSHDLYERLKSRNVIVLPGERFFFGLDGDWPHSRECLRLNYSGSEELFARGLRILGEELRKLY
jgi:valine--pyruvate aminotransferase